MRNKTVFTMDDVTPWTNEDLEGKFIILAEDSFKEEFRDAKYQLVKACSGFGCSPTASGRAIYVKECHNDNPETYRINRGDTSILGIAKPSAIKSWKALYGNFNTGV